MYFVKDIHNLNVTIYEFVVLYFKEFKFDLSNILTLQSNNQLAKQVVNSLHSNIFELDFGEQQYFNIHENKNFYATSTINIDTLIEDIPIYEKLFTRLMQDTIDIGFPQIRSNNPRLQFTLFDRHLANSADEVEEQAKAYGLNKGYIDFYYYKFTELLDWVGRYSIAQKYISEFIPQHYIRQDILDDLPMSIKMQISAYKHFDWDKVNNKSTSEYKGFEDNLISFLTKWASDNGLDKLLYANGKISGKVLEQVKRFINPKTER